MRWPSKPTRRRWLAFLRTPLTPLVLVPLLYFDAVRLQSNREAGLVSTIITEPFFGLGRNSGSYFDPRGAVVADAQDRVRILTTEQTYGNAGWDNPANGVIATLHLEPRTRYWGLWTRETRLFTRTLTVFVVRGDTPPRPTLEHWVDLWTDAEFLDVYGDLLDMLEDHPVRFAGFRENYLGARETATDGSYREVPKGAVFALHEFQVRWLNVAHSIVALLAVAAFAYSLATIGQWRPRVLMQWVSHGCARILNTEAHRIRHGRCVRCNYDLAGLTRCPECGEHRQIETL
ncbi:MAG: hypothetical protein AAF138_10850 [Planctomycetota bacterium]